MQSWNLFQKRKKESWYQINKTMVKNWRKNANFDFTWFNTIYKFKQILMNLWTINHSDDWGDPFNFRPERFLDESGSLLPATHPTRRRRVQHFNILEIFANKTRHSFERRHNKYIWCSFIQFWPSLPSFLDSFSGCDKILFCRIVFQMFLYQVLFN